MVVLIRGPWRWWGVKVAPAHSLMFVGGDEEVAEHEWRPRMASFVVFDCGGSGGEGVLWPEGK